jgi:PTS system mannose-specific IIA component
MIGMVLVAHGALAHEFKSALEHVVGPQEYCETIAIGPDDNMENRRNDILTAIDTADAGDGVIILTDMFGGTPMNIAAMFLVPGEVEIVTGVNLPMVIKLASQNKETNLEDLATAVEEQGKQAIHSTGTLLEPQKMKKDA